MLYIMKNKKKSCYEIRGNEKRNHVMYEINIFLSQDVHYLD